MNSKSVHLIRLDGSHTLGLGHVYRTRGLALQLRNEKQDSLFLVNNNSSVLKLLEDFKVKVLRDDYTDNEVNETMTNIIKTKNIRTIISDLLFYPKPYINFLKKIKLPKVSFHEHITDDNFSEILINYNTFKNSLSLVETKSLNCLGPKYCILPKTLLRHKPISVKMNVKKILLTFGGSDPTNFSCKVLTLLNHFKNCFDKQIEFTLHLGIANIREKEVKSIMKLSSLKFKLVREIDDFSNFMQEFDMAICSGGNTMYELCYLGIPSIVLPQNSHQENFARELHNNKFLRVVDINGSNFPNQFISNLLALLRDYRLRKDYQSITTKLFDGKGLERISQRIVNIQHC